MPIKNPNKSSFGARMGKSTLLRNKAESNEQSPSYSEDNYTQDFCEVERIYNGFIFLRNGSVVKILELLPINFSERDDNTKDSIADAFGYAYKQFPKNTQIKIMDAKADLDGFIRKVRKINESETDPRFRERVDDYIEHTLSLQSHNTNKKRFFVIFSYEGNSAGKKTDVLEDILDEMRATTSIIANAFRSIGNVVLNADSDSDYEAEILYQFFNPNSNDFEGFSQRARSVHNAQKVLEHKKNPKAVHINDYLAPRGIRFGKWNYMVMDGIYHTYLSLRDDTYPNRCSVGWIDHLFSAQSKGVDVDIKIRQQSKELAETIIDRTSIMKRGLAINSNGDTNRQSELMHEASNSEYILNCLKDNDEDLFDVNITVTLRAKSFKELTRIKQQFLKKMKSLSLYFEDCFLMTQDYFRNVLPLNLYVPDVFEHNKRNMTNSSLSSLYCFTTFEMFDEDGFCIGSIIGENSLFAINNFDRNIFPNPHIFIAGTTGAGKSFCTDMLSSRMRMSGMRLVYILPLKGHEYKDLVESLGGSFIPLYPGGTACLNICEIRPEDVTVIADEIDAEEVKHQGSMLTKKITSILTFISLVINQNLDYDIESELNVALTRMYEKFGITEDNESIWLDKKNRVTKQMPIISDIIEEIKDNPKLERIVSVFKVFTEGNCRNMNGQTNVDLTNKCIAFDINEDAIGSRLLPAFMYLAFDAAYDIGKSNLNEKCGLILDETWMLLRTENCAKQIQQAMKILRAYNCGIISATQNWGDCAKNEYGRSILTLSSIKIFLKSNKEEIDDLAKSVDMSQEVKDTIQDMGVGQCFIFYGTERIRVSLTASLLEREIYTPQPSEKAKIRKLRLEQKALKMG